MSITPLKTFAATKLTPPQHATESSSIAKRARDEAVLYALTYASEAALILKETATLPGLPPTVEDTLPRLAKEIEDSVARMRLAVENGRVR